MLGRWHARMRQFSAISTNYKKARLKMNEANQVYVPPKHIDAKEIPSAILSFLNGENLPSKSTAAINTVQLRLES